MTNLLENAIIHKALCDVKPDERVAGR